MLFIRTILGMAMVLLGVLTATGVGNPLNAQRQDGASATKAPGDSPSVFTPLSLSPAPSDTRLASGAPGPKYWQNRADYDLKVQLQDGIAHGSMVLRYTNNSPRPLSVLHFQVELNPEVIDTLAQVVNGQRVALQIPTPQVTPVHDLDVFYAALLVPLRSQQVAQVRSAAPGGDVHLATPLQPGETGTFYVTWHFFSVPMNRVSGTVVRLDMGGGMSGQSVSMGNDLDDENGVTFHGHPAEEVLPYDIHVVAQWFPRVAVYDDVTGWNTELSKVFDESDSHLQRRMEQNFLDYGDYTLEVTLLSKYIVAATGTLDNPGDVLSSTVQARLAVAATADTVVHVVTAADLKSGAARAKPDGLVTWKFHAKNVRDMVWCASPSYQWDATGWQGKLVQAYYWSQPNVTAWPQAAAMVRTALQEYSDRFSPYPYPQFSAVQSRLGLGVEYPMLGLVTSFLNPQPLYTMLSHVVAHTWFPMLVGSNERTHPWMDEGIATFMSTFAYPRQFPMGDDQAGKVRHFFAYVEDVMHANSPVEQENATDMLIEAQTGAPVWNSAYADYVKAAAGLQLLRREIIGPEKFDKALQAYIERWAYKHPTPADFFRTMSDVSGQQLDWFWLEWFLSRTQFDQTIEGVIQKPQGGENRVTIQYGNRARGVLPILARVTFSDGSTRDLSEPVDVWRADPARYTASYMLPNKTITRIELDPDHRLVDVDRANNVWGH